MGRLMFINLHIGQLSETYNEMPLKFAAFMLIGAKEKNSKWTNFSSYSIFRHKKMIVSFVVYQTVDDLI